MEYRHLRFFIAVAEDLSFTRAAERLNVAQPHLSREIRRLEERIGVTLFMRERQVTLTAAGQVFLAQARRILAVTDEAIGAAQRADRGETGRIRIGFSSSAGFGLLPDVVRRFRKQRPDVELLLSEFNSDHQPELLRGLELDVSLLYPPDRADDTLSTELLLVEPLVAALPAGHRLAERDAISVSDLADEPWIFFRRSIASRLYDVIFQSCRMSGFMPRVVQEGAKLSTIASLVASGLGVSLVPVSLARMKLRGAVCVPLEGQRPSAPLSVMWRRDDTNPALALFLETVGMVAKEFQAEGGWERET
jgi:DNA-binding transcriptional LysR family regulator